MRENSIHEDKYVEHHPVWDIFEVNRYTEKEQLELEENFNLLCKIAITLGIEESKNLYRIINEYDTRTLLGSAIEKTFDVSLEL